MQSSDASLREACNLTYLHAYESLKFVDQLRRDQETFSAAALLAFRYNIDGLIKEFVGGKFVACVLYNGNVIYRGCSDSSLTRMELAKGSPPVLFFWFQPRPDRNRKISKWRYALKRYTAYTISCVQHHTPIHPTYLQTYDLESSCE